MSSVSRIYSFITVTLADQSIKVQRIYVIVITQLCAMIELSKTMCRRMRLDRNR